MQDLLGGDSPKRRGRSGAHRRAVRSAAGLGLLLLVGAIASVSMIPLGGAPTAIRTTNIGSPVIAGAVAGGVIGQPAPDFVTADDAHAPLLVDLDGNPIRIHDFAGKPLWIVFWATWCTPCQEEAGAIRASYHAHRANNLAVLAIDIQEPAAAVRTYASTHDLDYAIGLDPAAAVRALYGGEGLPAHIFVGNDGVIRDRYLGQMTAELMEQHLKAIIGS
jgi:cytochrome c biogenesis protein CcmG, thiol:disulfide interchange protein DsbE